jgi:hypothetical protein
LKLGFVSARMAWKMRWKSMTSLIRLSTETRVMDALSGRHIERWLKGIACVGIGQNKSVVYSFPFAVPL